MALDPIQEASRDQFERHSANYGKSHILANTADIAAALADIEATPGSRALDVATGGGHTAIYLATRGFTVTASDISQAMLDNTKTLAAERGLSIETRLHEAEKFPYPANSYDLVTCRVAAHHFSDRESFLAGRTRASRPQADDGFTYWSSTAFLPHPVWLRRLGRRSLEPDSLFPLLTV